MTFTPHNCHTHAMTDLCLRATVRAIGHCLHTKVDNSKIGRYIVPLFSKSVVLCVYRHCDNRDGCASLGLLQALLRCCYVACTAVSIYERTERRQHYTVSRSNSMTLATIFILIWMRSVSSAHNLTARQAVPYHLTTNWLQLKQHK